MLHVSPSLFFVFLELIDQFLFRSSCNIIEDFNLIVLYDLLEDLVEEELISLDELEFNSKDFRKGLGNLDFHLCIFNFERELPVLFFFLII